MDSDGQYLVRTEDDISSSEVEHLENRFQRGKGCETDVLCLGEAIKNFFDKKGSEERGICDKECPSRQSSKNKICSEVVKEIYRKKREELAARTLEDEGAKCCKVEPKKEKVYKSVDG